LSHDPQRGKLASHAEEFGSGIPDHETELFFMISNRHDGAGIHRSFHLGAHCLSHDQLATRLPLSNPTHLTQDGVAFTLPQPGREFRRVNAPEATLLPTRGAAAQPLIHRPEIAAEKLRYFFPREINPCWHGGVGVRKPLALALPRHNLTWRR
jgi:hypothetical protein